MSKQGIYKISGNTKPKVGERVTYKIDEWYPATPLEKRNPALVTWHLFKRVNGKFVPTSIKKKGVSSFTFNTTAYKDTFRIEAYLHNPEGKAPMALEIQPQPSDVPRINKVELKYIDDTPGTVFSFTEKLVAEAKCMNLEGQYLQFTLWEDDAANSGHSNTNLLIDSKKAKVINGVARTEFLLTKALMKKAMEGETDPKQLEFYVTVEYYAHKKHATDNVNVSTPDEIRISPGQPQQLPAQPRPQQPPVQPQPTPLPEPQTAHGQASAIQPPASPPPGAISPTTINEQRTEDLLDAYFAKKEYTKLTGEEDGTHTYTFGGSKQNNKTSTAEEKNKVARTIINKIKDSLKIQKKYTTPEIITAALTADAYGKDTTNAKTVTFKTFKLGPEFKRVDNAPLEDKLYLVARTMLLDGKQVTISIKEKDGVIKGAAGAVLPVLEITEQQMEQKAPAGQVPGTEKAEFSGTVKNNMVKIPIHFRPKSDDELKQWKEKITKGKEDGTYTYTFGSNTNIADQAKKKSIAQIILDNAKKGNSKNPKIENGKTSSVEEIEKVLEIKNYEAGKTITFKLLKKVPELLYLHAKAQGEKQHDKEFLNKEGAYFQIGNKCPRCEAKITVAEFQEIFPEVKQLFYKGTNSLNSPSLENFLEALNKTLKEFDINTCIKKAFFLAQISKETGFFARIDENLYYTTEAALHNFWSKKNHPRLYSNPNEFFRNPEKLGNYVYRNVAENGDETSGDGYKYRGRGLIQITRKKGYRRFGEYVGHNLINNPDLLTEDLELTTRSAGWYWKHGVLLKNGSEKDLNSVAESGNFTEITRLVHGSTEDVAARETILSKIKSVLKTNECQKSNTNGTDADIEYHIQSSGEIQYKIQNQKRGYAAYFYHDNNGNIHELGKYKLNKVEENYGGVYKDKLGKDSNNIYLIDIRTVKQVYKNNGVGFTLTINTNRYYMNDVTLASLLGAMLECNYDDFTFNGFSNEKGESVGGSKSHKNGMNGDIRYLRKNKKIDKTDLFDNGEALGWKGLDEERQNNFNDSLYKFGWKSMLSQYFGEKKNKLLRHCTNDSDNNHNDHLHVQGYRPTLKEL